MKARFRRGLDGNGRSASQRRPHPKPGTHPTVGLSSITLALYSWARRVRFGARRVRFCTASKTLLVLLSSLRVQFPLRWLECEVLVHAKLDEFWRRHSVDVKMRWCVFGAFGQRGGRLRCLGLGRRKMQTDKARAYLTCLSLIPAHLNAQAQPKSLTRLSNSVIGLRHALLFSCWGSVAAFAIRKALFLPAAHLKPLANARTRRDAATTIYNVNKSRLRPPSVLPTAFLLFSLSVVCLHGDRATAPF